MSTTPDTPTTGLRTPRPVLLDRMRVWLDVAVHLTLLVAAAVLVAETGYENNFSLQMSGFSVAPLALLAAFAMSSEFASRQSVEGTFAISGSLLGIVGAGVLGGTGPAVTVAALVLVVGWFTYRTEARKLLHNIVNFIWFALLAALFFYATSHHFGATDFKDPVYYLLVFAAFIVAVVTNVALFTVYGAFLTRTPLRSNAPPLRPLIVAQSASAILTMVAVFAARQGFFYFALFGLVLLVFQRLMNDLWEAQLFATTDILTKLDNRNQFTKKLEKRIKAASLSGESFGVLLLDVDDFRDINDSHGHHNGDKLLEQLGARLNGLKLDQRFGENSVIARFGGDEFAILPENSTGSDEGISEQANRVLEAIRDPEKPITIELSQENGDTKALALQVEASIGVVRFPADGDDVPKLLRRADIAMYEAKDHHDDFQLFHQDLENKTTATQNLLAEFTNALDNDELVLYYHPIIDLGRRRVDGAEALIRWQHPDRGLLSPFAFINVVEQTSLIDRLTAQVLDKAIAECASWRAAGKDMSVGVNLSVRNLLDESLPARVSDTLERHGVPPEALKLEITESMIMSDSGEDRTVEMVKKLGRLGVNISVDDFGTGYSSLSKLRLLPIDELKIDRSFVSPMLNDMTARVIVKSTIALGKELGLKVVAEGVETAEILKELEKMKCHRAQGHFMSMPMPAAEFPEWCRAFEEGYRRAA